MTKDSNFNVSMRRLVTRRWKKGGVVHVSDELFRARTGFLKMYGMLVHFDMILRTFQWMFPILYKTTKVCNSFVLELELVPFWPYIFIIAVRAG